MSERKLSSVIEEAFGVKPDGGAGTPSGSADVEGVFARATRLFSAEASRHEFGAASDATEAFGLVESDRDVSSAAFDAAFGRRGWSTAASERAFALTPNVDVALESQLREAGLTSAAARGIVRDVVERRVSPSQAVTFSLAFDGIEPGRIPSLVESRALEILEGHGRAEATPRPQIDSGSSAIREARERVAEAHRAFTGYRDADLAHRMAEVYADSAVRSLTEWGIRDGWSEDQLVSRLEERATALRAERIPSGAESTGASGGGLSLGDRRRVREAGGQ